MTLLSSVPALPVRDSAAALAFYRERLGFDVVHADTDFAIVSRGRVEIHCWAARDTSWSGRSDFATKPVVSGAETFIAGTASCRIAVDDIDTIYAELSAANVLHPIDDGAPTTTSWGTREFPTLDLDGNLLTFYQQLR